MGPPKRPKTIAEWRAHVNALDADALWNKAAAANSPRFVRELTQEGYSASEVEQIFRAIAHRFAALGQRPPEGGWYDLPAMAREK